MANQGGSRDQHVKSGEQSHKNDEGKGKQQEAESGSSRQQGGGERGGSGNFANDREKASEAGRKGGKS